MKRILVLNFFPAFVPPASGGELRYFHIYRELSRHFDVTLLSPTYAHHSFEIVTHSPAFREYRVPKVWAIHDRLHMEIEKENIGTEFSALVCSLSAKHPNPYHTYYNELYPKADIIIHDCPFMLDYDLYFGMDSKPRIHNSYNFESLMFSRIWRGRNARKYIEHVRRLEGRLIREADLTFAITEEERSQFMEAFKVEGGKIRLAPNGIRPEDWKGFRDPARPAAGGRTSAFFIGSGHPPNHEAVDFILNKLAPACKDMDFVIAGSCCDRFSTVRRPPNVSLLGKIDDKEKARLFSTATVAVNPMFSGGGSNLKTLEFLSAGIPLLSTDVGVRGLDLTDDVHYRRAGKQDFSGQLHSLAQDADARRQLAVQGQAYINEHFSWQSIADAMAIAIHAIETPVRKKTLFLLNDFEVSSPSSGGEMRVNKLYSKLSANYAVILLCLNNSGEIKKTKITDSFIELSLPKTTEHLAAEQAAAHFHMVSTQDIINSVRCVQNRMIRETTARLYGLADMVVMIHPYLIMLLEGLKNKPVIYESLNFEVGLKKMALQGHPHYDDLIRQVELVEGTACRRSSLIISVSDDDHAGLAGLAGDANKRIVTIRNGVEVRTGIEGPRDDRSLKKMFKGRPLVLYVGSSHMPNVEGLHFIINHLAPVMVNYYFLVIGSVGDVLRSGAPGNVLLFGRVEDRYKEVLMEIADIAINPITSGSGSNLKLADYFAHKVATITTRFGSRGYDIRQEEEAIVCELTDFHVQIERLMADKELRHRLTTQAYAYVKRELDWGVLADRYNAVLVNNFFPLGPLSLTVPPVRSDGTSPALTKGDNQGVLQRPRLLVVTYRFTDPPLGGAEVFLLNLLKELNRRGDIAIDVAALDIVEIMNCYHFGINVTVDRSIKPASGLSGTIIRKFKTDILPVRTKQENAKALFRRWMEEFADSSLRHISRYPFPLLMGGWYYPEKTEQGFERWSSGRSLICTKGVSAMTVLGRSLRRKTVQIWSHDVQLGTFTVKGAFEISLRITNADSVTLSVETEFVNDDPRPLGIRISAIRCVTAEGQVDLQLDYDYRSYLQDHHYEDYIDELIHTARTRPEEFDRLFQRTRGPLSRDMEQWLDANVRHYDVVLGHSIPFATTNMAAIYAKKHTRPLVLLPHFHMDDEFYHWRSYYDALATADRVIVAPEASKRMFYDKIHAVTSVLPGGAVSPDEYDDVDSEGFRALCPSTLPIFLVLGRKTGGKNYQLIIDAIKQVNRDRKICEVVIIGRDEDLQPVDAREALYLGEQPRPVVLGALKECFCLVNMSQSESFGIVILEAWMLSKPVIVNEKCIAFRELVRDGQNGLLADKHNLTEKIRSLLAHRQSAELMGQSGRHTVQERYTWKALAGQFHEILFSLSGSGQRTEMAATE